MASNDVWEKARNLSDVVRKFADEGVAKALSENDLTKWMLFSKHRLKTTNIDNFAWIYDFKRFENYSIDDYIEEEITPDEQARAEKEAIFARRMYETLQTIPEKEGNVRVTLRRFREGKGWTYRVMAIFPEGTRLYVDPLLGDEAVTQENSGVIYSKVSAACMNHSCDELYKFLRDRGGAGHLRYLSPAEAVVAFKDEKGPVIEFMDPATRELKDKETYVFTMITGLLVPVERYRIPKQLLEKPK